MKDVRFGEAFLYEPGRSLSKYCCSSAGYPWEIHQGWGWKLNATEYFDVGTLESLNLGLRSCLSCEWWDLASLESLENPKGLGHSSVVWCFEKGSHESNDGKDIWVSTVKCWLNNRIPGFCHGNRPCWTNSWFLLWEIEAGERIHTGPDLVWAVLSRHLGRLDTSHMEMVPSRKSWSTLS